jgi:oligopeptide transport system permease protein
VGGVIIIIFFLAAIFAPLIAPYSFEKQTLIDNNAAPLWVTQIFPSMIPKGEPGGYVTISDKYPLGADDVGRDLFSRIVYGARVSLSVAIVGPFISLMIGVTYGTIAGYFGGRVDNIMMRFVDVMYAFPTLLLIILLMAFFRSTTSAPEPGTLRFYLVTLDNSMGGMLFIFIGIGITAWMSMARLTRGQILSLKEKEFIEAAHSMGVRDTGIMRKHILPNIVGPIVVAETLAIPTYIAYEAFLSFIGLGVNRPTPSWGSLIADGSRAIRTYPNQVIFPALALAIIMFAFNFLGDGLRDALDPRLRGTQ